MTNHHSLKKFTTNQKQFENIVSNYAYYTEKNEITVYLRALKNTQ